MTGEVLLVNMPFSGVDRPQIGIGLLKSALRSRGIPCDTAYLNHLLAERIGAEVYQWVSSGLDHTMFVGEWLFSQHFFGPLLSDRAAYIRHITGRGVSPEIVSTIDWISREIGPFLDHCMATVDWTRYSIVGFTSTFEQNMASLALAHAIKQRYPEKIIVMGGANCEHPMGLALHRCFPFVDYVFSGEADHSFPEFVEKLARHQSVTGVKGMVYRDGSASVYTGDADSIKDMDRLPMPDYDDYFLQIRDSPIARHVSPMLQIETARGCWWGAKHHCTFCGLNAATMAFRSKSMERALEEILHLVSRYSVKRLAAVDNIMDVQYMRDLLPELKRRDLELLIFYEVKANLSRDQVKLLAESGVTMIQPGIESLHSTMLKLMRKGISPLQNVQLLKWCKEFGVRPSWNLLYGFPGESALDYEEMLPLIQSVMHLTPPDGHGGIRLDRYSPYFQDPASFGLVNTRPMTVYKYIYPFDEKELRDIAYFYEYEFGDGLDPDSYIGKTLGALDVWRKAEPAGASLVWSSTAPNEIVIEDTRPYSKRKRTVLRGWQADLYHYCDQTRPGIAIERWLKENHPDVSVSRLSQLLDALVDWRVMARDNDHLLSLATRGPGGGTAESLLQSSHPAAHFYKEGRDRISGGLN